DTARFPHRTLPALVLDARSCRARRSGFAAAASTPRPETPEDLRSLEASRRASTPGRVRTATFPAAPSLDEPLLSCMFTHTCGINSAVECQLPKLKVAGSNPVSRSTNSDG